MKNLSTKTKIRLSVFFGHVSTLWKKKNDERNWAKNASHKLEPVTDLTKSEHITFPKIESRIIESDRVFLICPVYWTET